MKHENEIVIVFIIVSDVFLFGIVKNHFISTSHPPGENLFYNVELQNLDNKKTSSQLLEVNSRFVYNLHEYNEFVKRVKEFN